MLIDTHCHLTDRTLAPQAAAVLARARDAGVQRVITVAEDAADGRRALELLDRHAELALVAAVHPHRAGRCGSQELAELRELLRGAGLPDDLRRRIVALGETGLDYHYDFAPRPQQEQVFVAQLEIAEQLKLPVVIHARESELRICDMLRERPALAGRVVFHCFSGDTAVARRVLDLGNLLSFTGVITFKNAESIRAAARFAPAERIMLETDAPYLSPEPMRKVRPCEPALLVHTAKRLADIRQETLTALAVTTTVNATRFFGLDKE